MNELLLSAEFDARLAPLVSECNDFVSAPFFWNNQVCCRSHCYCYRYYCYCSRPRPADPTRRDPPPPFSPP